MRFICVYIYVSWVPSEYKSDTGRWSSFFALPSATAPEFITVLMYEESLGGPPVSMPGHGHNLPLMSDYGLHPNGSYPRHGTHQRLAGAYSPSLPSSGLPAMLAREGISQSRPASPHMSQFNFQSQTDVYTGGYPESEVDILESADSTAPPNASRFNLPSFPSIHNLSRGSAHRTVRNLLCPTLYLISIL